MHGLINMHLLVACVEVYHCKTLKLIKHFGPSGNSGLGNIGFGSHLWSKWPCLPLNQVVVKTLILMALSQCPLQVWCKVCFKKNIDISFLTHSCFRVKFTGCQNTHFMKSTLDNSLDPTEYNNGQKIKNRHGRVLNLFLYLVFKPFEELWKNTQSNHLSFIRGQGIEEVWIAKP